MSTKNFYFTVSRNITKYYQIYEYSGKFKAVFKYKDNLVFGKYYSEIGKANTFDDAMLICRSHALQFGNIEKMEFF